jgi:hypothetical protein
MHEVAAVTKGPATYAQVEVGLSAYMPPARDSLLCNIPSLLNPLSKALMTCGITRKPESCLYYGIGFP